MAIQTFRDLIAWQKAKELAKQIYTASATMPDSERFGLIAQMRRAAISVAANIAEGYGRQSLPDYLRFLRTSRGSLMELQTHMIIAEELKLLRVPIVLGKLCAETDRVLQALIRSLEKYKN